MYGESSAPARSKARWPLPHGFREDGRHKAKVSHIIDVCGEISSRAIGCAVPDVE
jgi:hypothetical protein